MSETYGTILRVARDLFVRQGYTASSIRQIAKAAGIGKATVYHHFRDKQSIILALMKDTSDHQKAMMESLRAEADPQARIELALASSIRTLLKDMNIIQIARRELPAGKDGMKEYFSGFLKDFRALLAETIQEGIRKKLFRGIDPAAGSRVLMTMIQGTFAMAYLSGDRSSSPDDTADSLIDVFFNGVMKT